MDTARIFGFCIYTMKKSVDLERCYSNGGKGSFSEKRSWKTGYRLFLDAVQKNEQMLVLFSAAEEASGIIFIGILDSIILSEDEQEGTVYSFRDMVRLQNPKPLSSLILKSTYTPLSDQYIRPYAICNVPADLEKWIMEQGLPNLSHSRKTGAELFYNKKFDYGFSLKDYWQWSASDLVDNTQRGILAEYLVAKSLGLAEEVRSSWDAYDLLLPNGIKIEVKSAAYIQSWYQQRYSKIVFSIRKTHEWSGEANQLGSEKHRQADIYVFCLLNHKIQETFDPMDLDQWEFFILPTKKLNEHADNRSGLSLAALKKLNPIRADYMNLKDKIYLVSEQCHAG